MKKISDKWTQLGIVSFGNSECSSDDLPNVYARVSSYLDWIEPIFDGGEPEGRKYVMAEWPFCMKVVLNCFMIVLYTEELFWPKWKSEVEIGVGGAWPA